MRSMVEGALGAECLGWAETTVTARAPSTTLLRSVGPLPRSAGQESTRAVDPRRPFVSRRAALNSRV
jgi:hypothetical protein